METLLGMFVKQWEVVKNQPLVILPALIILTFVVGVGEYIFFFKENIGIKNDVISTLKDQVSVLKEQVASLNAQLVTTREIASKAQDTAATLATVAARPNLQLSMSGGNVFVPDAPGVKQPLTGIAIAASVWNTAEPSVATNWSLVVIPKGQIPVLAQLTKIPDRLTASGPINSAVIHGSDALDIKTKKEPIKGIPIEGTLLFYVPIEQSIILEPTTTLELSVKDIYGGETIARQVMGRWLKL